MERTREIRYKNILGKIAKRFNYRIIDGLYLFNDENVGDFMVDYESGWDVLIIDFRKTGDDSEFFRFDKKDDEIAKDIIEYVERTELDEY